MTDAAIPPPPRLRRPSAFVAAFLGWWIPGLGHAWVGRPRKGVFFAVVVLSAYVLGLALGDFRCVSLERDPYWFAAQAVLAGPTALVSWLTSDLALNHRVPTFDLGLLYTSVASLLNAVVVADAIGIADEMAARSRAAEREAAIRAAEEALAAPPPLPESFPLPEPDLANRVGAEGGEPVPPEEGAVPPSIPRADEPAPFEAAPPESPPAAPPPSEPAPGEPPSAGPASEGGPGA